jgi:hypothetical protein
LLLFNGAVSNENFYIFENKMINEYGAFAGMKMERSRSTWRNPAPLMYRVTIKEIYVIKVL